jgi:cardiolipin synthase
LVTTYGLSIVLVINFILTFTIIFLERKNPQSTYAWLLLLWMIPAVGFVFYLFFSQNLTRRKIFKLSTSERALTNGLIQQQKRDLTESETNLESPYLDQYRDMILFHLNLSDAIYTDDNKVEIIVDGAEKFDTLIRDIQQAKDHIHIQYFIFKSSELADRIMAALKQKALDGVEVRLLFDDMGAIFLKRIDFNDLKQSGVQVARFFPSRVKFVNLKANYRNHRKVAVIDGRIGYVGGFNVGDEYLGLNAKMGYWRDTHLRLEGSAVYELQLRFFMDWRASNPETIQLDYRYMPKIPKHGAAGVQIVSSGPDDHNEQIKQGYLKMIHAAKSYIYIQTPYFVPDQSILEGLKIAAQSGVDVRIMIPNKPDHLFVYWATFSYVGELLEYGAKIYVYDNGFLHAKTIVVDDALASVGTCNFDIRSFSLNFEVNAFIYDQETSFRLKEIFIEDLKHSVRINESRYERRPVSMKIKESISRLFSPIL